MSLDEYTRKRDFTQSPEPAGRRRRRSPAGRAPRRFCVQKHLASQLHYDFRLEHDGVLLSWAVPKGPALDPATKRLAMQVEDHPIEYGTFEGVIPSGYGAGIVMLWDEGTWMPETDDVEAALRKGDLKFTLDGVKLKGSWVLVRTRGWRGGGAAASDGRSWLLIKHRDDWAGEVDITAFAPLSVKSGGDFADILSQEDPAIWQSHQPARSGDSGALFERIVRRALEMRVEGAAGAAPPARTSPRKTAPAQRTARPTAARTPAARKTDSPSATDRKTARRAKGPPATTAGATARGTGKSARTRSR
jgi:bifunctional non-homologous end joining protein LigD